MNEIKLHPIIPTRPLIRDTRVERITPKSEFLSKLEQQQEEYVKSAEERVSRRKAEKSDRSRQTRLAYAARRTKEIIEPGPEQYDPKVTAIRK